MAENNNLKIAVIVEDQNLQDYIVMLLVGEGYEVKTFSNQADAIAGLDKEVVDLIISEFQSPHIDGLDICKVLRKNFLYNLIPMLFIIPDDEPLDAAKLIYAGADDYIKKSLVQDELFLKVKLNTYRLTRQQDVNNITRLPGYSYLLKELQKRLDSKEQFAVAYLDLYKFKEFIYLRGSEIGDALIKYTASLIYKTLKELGGPFSFLCHIQSNEFIFIALPEKIDSIINGIINEFDQNIASFYAPEDRINGYCLIKNRNGQVQKVPFTRARMGVVVNMYLAFFNPERIIQIAGEIKDSILCPFGKSAFEKEAGRGYSL